MQKLTSFGFWTGKSTFFRLFFDFFFAFFLHFSEENAKTSRKKVDLLVKIDFFRPLDGQINFFSTFFRLFFAFFIGNIQQGRKKVDLPVQRSKKVNFDEQINFFSTFFGHFPRKNAKKKVEKKSKKMICPSRIEKNQF